LVETLERQQDEAEKKIARLRDDLDDEKAYSRRLEIRLESTKLEHDESQKSLENAKLHYDMQKEEFSHLQLELAKYKAENEELKLQIQTLMAATPNQHEIIPMETFLVTSEKANQKKRLHKEPDSKAKSESELEPKRRSLPARQAKTRIYQR
jgi:hypothetical protein